MIDDYRNVQFIRNADNYYVMKDSIPVSIAFNINGVNPVFTNLIATAPMLYEGLHKLHAHMGEIGEIVEAYSATIPYPAVRETLNQLAQSLRSQQDVISELVHIADVGTDEVVKQRNAENKVKKVI